MEQRGEIINSSRPIFKLLPDSPYGNALFFALLSLVMALGLGMMFWRDFGLVQAALLLCHQLLGGLLMLMLFGLAIRGLVLTLGWFWTLVRLPIHALVIMANLGLFFSTPEVLIVATALLFWIDWKIIRWGLVRSGKSMEEIRRSRSGYVDFALTAGAILSGLLVTNNTPAVRDAHAYHAFSLPILLIWFASKRFGLLSRPKQAATVAFYFLVFSVFGYLHYNKRYWRGDEADLGRPDVIQTVHTRAEAESLHGKQFEFTESVRCAQCHPVQFFQWAGSVHRFSTDNQIFQKVVRLFIEQEGVENVRTCMNCHDPAAAVRPDSEQWYASGQISNPEGVSCTVCHSISDYDRSVGSGKYTLKQAPPYPFADSPMGSEGHKIHDRLIRLDPRMHLRSVQRGKAYRTGDFCISCHRLNAHDIFPDAAIHLVDVFTDWEQSPWRSKQNCVDCHMPRYQMDTEGYAVFDHRIMGINAEIGDYAIVGTDVTENLDDLRESVLRYTAGDLAVGEYEMLAPGSEYIFHQNPGYEPSGPLFSAPLEMKRFNLTADFLQSGPFVELSADFPPQLRAGEFLPVKVQTRNVRVGHSFPGGLVDLHDIWLEALLFNDSGELLAHIGNMRKDGTVDADVPILGVRDLLDQDGNPLRRHEFWRAVTATDLRIIQPFETVTDEIQLLLPENPAGHYTLVLRWNYRKLRPETARWVWGDRVDVRQHRALSWIEIPFAVIIDASNPEMFSLYTETPGRPPYSENIADMIADL